MNELLQFTKDVLAEKGALLDIEPGRIKAVIPKDTADTLSVSEFSTFTGDEEPARNEIFLAYGSDMIEKLMGLIENEGKTSRFLLSGVQSSKEIDESDIRKKFQFINTKLGAVESIQGIIPYYIFNFRYSLISDERKDGIVTVTVNGLALAEVTGMEEFSLQCWSEEYAETGNSAISPEPVSSAYRKATIEARRKIETGMEHFKTILSRRLERDTKRLEEYYGNLFRELGRRRRGKKDSPEASDDLTAKAEAVRLEYESKRADIEKKYDTKITVSLFSGALMFIPSAIARVEVHYKKERRTLSIPWNPLLKTLEDVTCEGCLANTTRIYFCPNLHLVCDRCSGTCPECGKKYCRTCLQGKTPCEHVNWSK